MRSYKKTTLIILLLAFLVFPSKIYALDCAIPEPLQAIHDYEAVFIGKVISSSDLTKNTKLEVVQSWKGVNTMEVKIYEDNVWGNTYKAGDKILVFANKEFGFWKVPLCAPIQQNVDETNEEWDVFGEPVTLKHSTGLLPLYLAVMTFFLYLLNNYFKKRKKSGSD
ncbi:hypothetical protein [Bacillus mesophilum]|uniref:CbiN domain protein n=1 Tax=Bacillus mesophilum TaxID=1071718 RepID=A0A7V7RJ74_9BACI|nr:hypothetical protein [Bacillus mesophilum]KAB2330640.1 hypothetical protein F7732_18505 [Bacillus mesophilum]